MRLNKYLAQNLQISRRNADEKIAAGHVKINNEKASVGTIVNEHDVVEVDGQEIKSRTKHEYYKFYKPKGYICSHEKQGDSPLNINHNGEVLKISNYKLINKYTYEVALKTGKNHEIRRIFRFNNLKIISLKRNRIGKYSLKELSPGDLVKINVNE